MLAIGMLVLWGGYAMGSWGYVLVKGYNITLREWVTPLHPFTGPLDANGTVPHGFIFPTAKGASSSTTNTATSPAPSAASEGPAAVNLGTDIGNIIAGLGGTFP